MRGVIFFLFACCLVVAGCDHGPELTTDGVTVISVWHPWGGVQKERFDKVVEAFNKSHPHIQVRSLFTPNDLSSNQKFFTAIAANKPPDAVVVDGQQTASWAEQGALEPLDDLIEREGIRREDYVPPCWAQNEYRGRVWALTYSGDPNFAFLWNKKVFREVGLDPEKPPATIEELDKYNDIITKIDGGKIVRMGIIPWSQFGGANSIFTWGWVFGGEFYDPETGKVTANDPRVVKALEWMTSYAKKYDVTTIGSFASGFGSREQNPVYIGQVAMSCIHISQLEEIAEYAPNLDYGLGFIPAHPDGEQQSSWIGGWCLGIPKGSRHREAAWTFIKWMCHDREGTLTAAKIQGLFPGYAKSPYFDEIRNKPGYSEFLSILESCRHQRPVMPAQAYLMNELNRAVDFAVYGRMDPKSALNKATTETQAELDLMLAGR